ncbi:MAG: FAD-dependent oxidoreductase [Dehalococcoidia bacterium]
MNSKNKILVIGGTACGPKAAARARRCDPEAQITIIEQSPYISSATCGLPYYIDGIIPNQDSLTVRGPRYFKQVLNIDVLVSTRALSIDRSSRKVQILDMATNSTSALEYDKLVLATGTSPVVPDIPGVKLAGIHTLSNITDAVAVKKYLTPEIKQATIIGAGLIGMEMAESLASLGVGVTVVEMKDWLLPSLLDFEMAAYVEKQARQKGVKFLFGQRVTGFEGDSAGRVFRVMTAKGQVASDIVILAIGVRPNISLAMESKLEIGEKGGIKVNQFLQTSDPAIYAGGDCVENIHRVTGQPVLVPLGSTANKHGRIIGTNITGGKDPFPGVLGTSAVKIFDTNVACTGLNESGARENSYDILTCLVPGEEHARYYPGAKEILIKLIAEKNSGKVLGGQIVGPGEAVKRVDVLASSITFGATVDDLANLDLAYAPPYNNAMDPLHNAANVIRNKQAGLAEALTPMEVEAKIRNNKNFIFLDVRTEKEWNEQHIPAPQVLLMPLDNLRKALGKLPKNAEIVTLCRVSIRAYQAQRILKGAGFSKVKFVDGSLTAWPYELTG